MNSGRIATAVGNSSPNTNSVNSASRPRNCIRANTNAASDANTTATDDRDDGDDQAVAELAPEGRRVLADEDVVVVLEDPRVGQDLAGVGRQLAVGLEPAEDRVPIGIRIAAATTTSTT